MSTVFLDTVGLVALWNADDQWHEAAYQAFVALTAQKKSVITTTFVLLECGNTGARRQWRPAVNDLRLKLESTGKLIIPSESDWQSAWAAYGRGETDRAGIVDQVSFAVMRRYGINESFTNDKHFRAAGFLTLF